MNPIENVWAGIQKPVSDRLREDYGKIDKQKLWEYITNSWKKLDDTDLIETLYRSMPNQMREVIQKRGHSTHY